ncbi:uncharacterized protein ASCRUDRAFT_70199 [Ascoidea rubescens DSM 1968]|uniref:JAB1/MPN/MOV34 metalloenzyme domain-containing protein n=1 Tax=Ascoidea rubescens DSM 1968 TaxID=1344418 RepID=A0A1D2VH56_9ASCO|nr:hypothetical protein ASCRUDRAFT_70199 [Ascoidea rubescens DSM 1968]ODV60955.1 hypothetical protein ASCRUDRAFT_70199 [Ascoidea rubescens DSM 1968]
MFVNIHSLAVFQLNDFASRLAAQGLGSSEYLGMLLGDVNELGEYVVSSVFEVPFEGEEKEGSLVDTGYLLKKLRLIQQVSGNNKSSGNKQNEQNSLIGFFTVRNTIIGKKELNDVNRILSNYTSIDKLIYLNYDVDDKSIEIYNSIDDFSETIKFKVILNNSEKIAIDTSIKFNNEYLATSNNKNSNEIAIKEIADTDKNSENPKRNHNLNLTNYIDMNFKTEDLKKTDDYSMIGGQMRRYLNLNLNLFKKNQALINNLNEKSKSLNLLSSKLDYLINFLNEKSNKKEVTFTDDLIIREINSLINLKNFKMDNKESLDLHYLLNSIYLPKLTDSLNTLSSIDRTLYCNNVDLINRIKE